MRWLSGVEAQRTDVQTTLERTTCFSLLVDFVAIPPPHLRVRTKPGGFEFGSGLSLGTFGWFDHCVSPGWQEWMG